MAEDQGKDGPANSAGETGGQAPADAGSATKVPAYDQKGQPLPIGVNRTDAPGATSGYDAGAAAAARGESEEVARAREIVRRADAERAALGEGGRLPHVLKTNLHVRRGNQIHNIPAGTVVQDTDLTDEEWDQLLKDGSVGEASVGELRAHEARVQRDEDEAKAKEQRRATAGTKVKGSKGTKAPRGSTLVADLNEGAQAGALAAAARQAIVAGSVVGAPAAPSAESIEEARAAGERARAEAEAGEGSTKKGGKGGKK